MKNLLFGKSIQNNKKQRDKRLFMNEKRKNELQSWKQYCGTL